MSNTITLSPADNNGTVNCAIGDIIDVILPSNPSTGFLWTATDTSAGHLERVQHDSISNKPGSVQSVRFRFIVERAGTFTLNYARPWAELAPPSKWFSVEIKV